LLKNSHSTKGGIKIKKFTIILIFTAIILLFFSYQIFQQDVIRLSDKESQNIESVYLIKESGTYTDILQKISIKGYKDKIIMFLRIDMINNIISDLDIVEENETSNYGGHITEDWFEKRFIGKNTDLKLKLVKMSAEKPEEVVAVTGATISSQAVIMGVNKALKNYQDIKINLK